MIAGAYVFISFSDAQHARPLSANSHRRLPTVIITREHLRQRQNSYGTYGDTAAEFVVSAGLDNSKNSAVRIRRIGGRQDNVTHDTGLNPNRLNFPSNNGDTFHTNIKQDQRYRTPISNPHERNSIPNTYLGSPESRYHLNEGHKLQQPINRRNHLNENDHRIRSSNGGYFRHTFQNQEVSHLQYRPPIFVPNYQQVRRADAHFGIPGELSRRPPNVINEESQRRSSFNYNEPQYPIINVKYSTSSVSASTSAEEHQRKPVSYSAVHNNIRPPAPNYNNPHGSIPNSGRNQDNSFVPQISHPNRKPSVPVTINNKHQNDKQNIGEINQGAPTVLQITNQDNKPWAPIENNDKQQTDKQNIRETNPRTPFVRQNNTQNQHEEKPVTKVNSTDHLYINPKNPSIYTFKQNSEKLEVNSSSQSFKPNKSTVHEERVKTDISTKNESITVNENEDINEKTGNKTVVPRNPVIEIASPNNVLTEIPASQNSVNIREFQTRLIRKPSLILRDQITVNELPRKSNRPRYGPRALADLGEIRSSTRQKRQADNYHYIDSVNTNRTNTAANNSIESDGDKIEYITTSSTVKHISSPTITSAQRQGRYNTNNFQIKYDPTKTPRGKFPVLVQKKDYPIKNEKSFTDAKETRLSPNYYTGEQFSDGTYQEKEEDTPDEVMSFSDFLASPIAEKLRLERQSMFKNSNKNGETGSIGYSRGNHMRYDPRSLKNSTLEYLKKLITARLIHHVLNSNNMSANHSALVPAGRGFDGITSEQRHYGYMMNPYDEMENDEPRPSKQRVKILRGKIIPISDLPPEIIPVLLGTYKPAFTNEIEEPYQEDSKLTENMIDNAIFALLQNEGIIHGVPVLQKGSVPYKVHRKSPSTNYVGSLKSNEALGKPSYNYKPRDWPLGPRCDRLTEEICLDDSDYPK